MNQTSVPRSKRLTPEQVPVWRAPVALHEEDTFTAADQAQPVGYRVADDGTVEITTTWRIDPFALAALIFTQCIDPEELDYFSSTLEDVLRWLVPSLLHPGMWAVRDAELEAHDEVAAARQPQNRFGASARDWFGVCARQALTLTCPEAAEQGKGGLTPMRVPFKIAIPVITVIDLFISASAAHGSTRRAHGGTAHEVALFFAIFIGLGLLAVGMHLHDQAKDRRRSAAAADSGHARDAEPGYY